MLKSFKSCLSLKIFIFFSKLIFEILYLNKRAHETDRKSSSDPANITCSKSTMDTSEQCVKSVQSLEAYVEAS